MLNMKKIVAVSLSVITLLISMNCANVFAQEATINDSIGTESTEPRVAQYVWVDTDVLNVRSGPGTNYNIVGQVYQDQRLWITFAQYDDYGVDWYKCNAVGGWVCSLYVRYEA